MWALEDCMNSSAAKPRLTSKTRRSVIKSSKAFIIHLALGKDDIGQEGVGYLRSCRPSRTPEGVCSAAVIESN